MDCNHDCANCPLICGNDNETEDKDDDEEEKESK